MATHNHGDRAPEPVLPPAQYATDEHCACGTRLSRYNRYWVCGACRHKLYGEGVDKFPRRHMVRRGPLLADEATPDSPAELPEPEPEQPVPIDPMPVEGEAWLG